METKVCSKCGKEKELDLFHNSSRTKDGKRGVCKECTVGHVGNYRNTKNSKLMEENLRECNTCKEIKSLEEFDKITIEGKEYYQASCKGCRNKLAAIRRKEDGFYYRRDIRKKYGITIEEYYTMIDLQENKCKICGEIFTDKKIPEVDHCHTKGNVIGLLCHNCNSGIGMFHDNIESLKNAILYLENV